MRNALLSLSNKTRCLELVDFLIGKNCNIIASKGTYNYLYGCVPNTNLKKIDDMIQFPIVLEQHMKCFHPAIFTGLLADTAYTKQNNYLKPHNITTIDITVANLYPFEKMIHGFFQGCRNQKKSLVVMEKCTFLLICVYSHGWCDFLDESQRRMLQVKVIRNKLFFNRKIYSC